MPVTIDLKGKLVLVTGGGRGLGTDIVKGMAEGKSAFHLNPVTLTADPALLNSPFPAGADIALTYNATTADDLAEEISKTYSVNCKAYQMPAGESALIDETVNRITKEMGEIDVVIANAGICLHVDAVDTTDKQFEDTFAVNTFAPFYLSRAAYKTWFPTPETPKKNKIILFVSSMSGLVYNFPQNQVAYNASKAALTMLGKSLAGEWSSKGVRVNILSPGYIATDMSTGSAGGNQWLDEWKARTPLARFAQPKEIADMLVVMASDKTTFMTGSDVVLDGGYTIY